MMSDPDGNCDPGDDESLCEDLLNRLNGPLSFIGEKRISYAQIGGHWVEIENLISEASKHPRHRDRILSDLRERLAEIRAALSSRPLTGGEAVGLFEEGIAVKRAIYLLTNGGGLDDDQHSDMKRWLSYGRRIK